MLVLKIISTEERLKTLGYDLSMWPQTMLVHENSIFCICSLFISQLKNESHHNILKYASLWNNNSNLKIPSPTPTKKKQLVIISHSVHNFPVHENLYKPKKIL